jgi:hypothetical protein
VSTDEQDWPDNAVKLTCHAIILMRSVIVLSLVSQFRIEELTMATIRSGFSSIISVVDGQCNTNSSNRLDLRVAAGSFKTVSYRMGLRKKLAQGWMRADPPATQPLRFSVLHTLSVLLLVSFLMIGHEAPPEHYYFCNATEKVGFLLIAPFKLRPG